MPSRVRYAGAEEVRYYRIGNDPTFRTEPAHDLSLAANMARVYQHIEMRRIQNLRTFPTNGNGHDENRHGPSAISAALGLPEDEVRKAIKRPLAACISKTQKAEPSGP